MEDNVAQEQPIVTVTAQVMRKTYRRFFFHWMARMRPWYYAYLAICLLSLVAIVWITFSDFGSHASSALSFFLILMMLVLPPKRYYDMHREMYLDTREYIFYQEHFTMRCDTVYTIDLKTTTYSPCKASETKSAFYLLLLARPFEAFYWGDYFDPDPYCISVILDKRYLAPDQIDALRDLFSRKFGEKFRQQKR